METNTLKLLGVALHSAMPLEDNKNSKEFRRLIVRLERRQRARKVRQLYAMLDGTSCRTAAVRRYFGETAVGACGQCDLLKGAKL